MRHAHRVVSSLTLLMAWASLAHAEPFAYVANRGDGTVSVVDTRTNAVVETVPVGTDPLGVAVSPLGERVYVANQVMSGTVSVIDAATNTVVDTLTVGREPTGLAVKYPGTKLYVANRIDKTVSVIDLATGDELGPIDVGNNPLGVAVNPAGTPAYVVNKGSNTVSVIDTNFDEVIATVDVGNDPQHVAVHPNGRWVYVTNTSNASVTVIDAASNAAATTIPVGTNPEGLALLPSGLRMYVANEGPDTVSVIDTSTNTVVNTIDVGTNPNDVAVTPDGTKVFVTNRAARTVSVIDVATETVVATVDVGFTPVGLGVFIRPGLEAPRFVKKALACQAAIGKAAAKVATFDLAQSALCLARTLKAEAAGTGMEQAAASCAAALNLGNPASKLARARAAAGDGIVKKCTGITPQAVGGPCLRNATSFAETSACILNQHTEQVEGVVEATFSSDVFGLDRSGLACQNALAGQGRKLADVGQKSLAACLDRLLKAATTGKPKDRVRAVAGCLKSLNLADPGSKLAKTRARGTAAVVKKCKDVDPFDIGPPCVEDPSTGIAGVASCVLGRHLAASARMTAARYNDACPLVTSLGIGPFLPAVCEGP